MPVKHREIQALYLADGDLMRIGSSTNYVLVHSAVLTARGVAVTIYNGDEPADRPAMTLDPSEMVSLSMRGAAAEQPRRRFLLTDELTERELTDLEESAASMRAETDPDEVDRRLDED